MLPLCHDFTLRDHSVRNPRCSLFLILIWDRHFFSWVCRLLHPLGILFFFHDNPNPPHFMQALKPSRFSGHLASLLQSGQNTISRFSELKILFISNIPCFLNFYACHLIRCLFFIEFLDHSSFCRIW